MGGHDDADVHEVRVHPVARYGQRNERHYVAICPCGWTGNVQRTEVQALRDGDEHRQAM